MSYPARAEGLVNMVLSRFWTRVAVTISCVGNHYTTGYSIVCVCVFRSILGSSKSHPKRRAIAEHFCCNNIQQLIKLEKLIQKSALIFVKVLFTQPLRSGRIWHKVNFEAEFNRFEFRVFSSPRLVASPWLKNLVCPTIYP